jgi:hypothetical protein
LQAIRVKAATLPPPFDTADCTSGYCLTMWVGDPVDVSEVSGIADDTPPTFRLATLQCEPHWADWASAGPVFVTGEQIVPGGRFEIQAINDGCSPALEADYSAPLVYDTSVWGDLVTDCSNYPCGPPQGSVNFDDIAAIVAKFANKPGAPSKTRADMSPSMPDKIIDFVDISRAVDAFRGLVYPFTGPPPTDPCE